MARLLLAAAAVVLALCALPAAARAQSADQEIVSATDSPDPVVPGGTLTYTVQVRNNGPNAAVNGGVNIALPSQVTYQTHVVPAGFTCVFSGSFGTCATPSFAAGATATITVTVAVASSLASASDGTFSASFSTAGTTSDPDPSDNAMSVTTAYDSPQIDLFASVSDAPDPVFRGDDVTFTVNAGNSGPDAATAVTLTLLPHDGYRFVSLTAPAGWTCSVPAAGAVDATVSCSRGTLPAAPAGVFTLVLRTPSGAGSTNANLDAVISGTGNETDMADNIESESTHLLVPSADLSVTKTGPAAPVAGDPATYTITLSNDGPQHARDVTLTDELPSGLRFHSLTAPGGWSCTAPDPGSSGPVSCTAGVLPNGASATFELVAVVDPAGAGRTIATTASASSSASDPDPSGNAATATSQARGVADVSAGITAPDAATAGEPLTYVIGIGASGPSTAADATLAHAIPAGAAFVSLRQTAGPALECVTPLAGASGTITCTGALQPIESATIEVTVTPTAGGTLALAAMATSEHPDPDASDDDAQDTVAVAAAPQPPVTPPAVMTPRPAIPPPVAQPPATKRLPPAISGPSCASRRRFTARLNAKPVRGIDLTGARIRRAEVRTTSGRLMRKLRFKGTRVAVDLRGLPRRTYVLRLTVRLKDGRAARVTRTYRTCRPRR